MRNIKHLNIYLDVIDTGLVHNIHILEKKPLLISPLTPELHVAMFKKTIDMFPKNIQNIRHYKMFLQYLYIITYKY